MSFPRSHYSGFPFNAESVRDEFPFNRNRDGDLKSTLDDIAKRHPELAEHFQNLDQRPKSRNRPTEELKAKFRRPFGDSFPFDDDFDLDKEFPQKFCDPKEFYDPQGHFPQTSSYQEPPRRNENNTHSQQTGATASQNIQPETNLPKSTQIPDKEKIGIQQSNTVDLGQKQEPIDDRNQRSMSAPPGGETQKRYKSSINIPVNTPPENMSHNQHQHQEPKSNERIIPIQVEGRDIPVMPKNTHIPQTQSHQIPQRHEHFSRTGFPEEHFSQNFPYNFQQQHPKDDVHIPVQRENSGTEQRQHPPQTAPQPQQWAPQSAPQPQQWAPQSAPQPQKVDTPEATAPPPERKQVVTPIEQIQEIQKDVSNLMQQVENFTGKSKDKEYLYLDEMLTRNLIKLDNIDTQGQENIRLSRKEAIRCIQLAISLLESKAVSGSEKSSAEEQPPAVSNNNKPEETDKGNSIDNQKTESQPSIEIEKMETTENDVNDPNQKVSSESTNQETRAVLVDAKDVNVLEKEAVVTESSNQDTREDQKNDKCEKEEKNKCSQK